MLKMVHLLPGSVRIDKFNEGELWSPRPSLNVKVVAVLKVVDFEIKDAEGELAVTRATINLRPTTTYQTENQTSRFDLFILVVGSARLLNMT